MNSHKLLDASINSLKGIKKEMHDGMDGSKQDEIAEVIKQLEKIKADNEKFNSTQLLVLLGRVMSLIPAVEDLIKLFRD